MNLPEVEIFTDGACRGNPGPGGWGVLLRTTLDGKVKEQEIYGGAPETTNNRMEMQAVIEGLGALEGKHQVRIVTDSKYVKQGSEEWLAGWKKRGWRTASKTAVKNQALWQTLDKALSEHQVEWFWVKGHSGHRENDIADALANRGIDEILG